MKKDIILAGVGGQGILSIAAIIGAAALDMGLNLKQSEVHGMSQRGGDVSSNLRISDKEIFSDLIPIGKADIIISVEPMECLRYLPFLHTDGWVITDTTPFINIPNYPSIENVLAEIKKIKNHVALDAETIAKEVNSRANMVILGAATPYLGIEFSRFEKAIHAIFGSKGEELVASNIAALKAGRVFSEKK